MRTFDSEIVVEKFYSNLFNHYNPDVFISTWDNRGKSQHHNGVELDNAINECDVLNVYKNVKDIEIENFDNWIKNQNEELIHLWNSYKVDGVWKPTSIPQFYKINRANCLKSKYEKENDFKYDIVIRYRPDLIMVDKLNIDSNVNNTIVNINTQKYHWPNRIYDIFFYSNSSNMDKISEIWPNFRDVLNHPFSNGLPNIDPCRMLYVQADNCGLNVESIDRNICDVYRNEPYHEIEKFLLG